MMRRALFFLLAVACSHGVRKDVTPPLAVDAPSAAAHEAGLIDGPELTPHEMAEHALSRLTFGARAQDRERIGREGIATFVEEQLHPEQIDDSAVEQRLASLDVLDQGRAELTQRLVAFRKANQLHKRNDDLLETAPPPPPGEEMAPPRTAGPAQNPPRPPVRVITCRHGLARGWSLIAELRRGLGAALL